MRGVGALVAVCAAVCAWAGAGVTAYNLARVPLARVAELQATYLPAKLKTAVHVLYHPADAGKANVVLTDFFKIDAWNNDLHVSHDCSMLKLDGTKVAYLSQAVIDAANKALSATHSNVLLTVLKGVDPVACPWGPNFAPKPESQPLLAVAFLDGQSVLEQKPPLRETVQDCNRMASQVIGAFDANPSLYVAGRYRVCGNPLYGAQRMVMDSWRKTAAQMARATAENDAEIGKRWAAAQGVCPGCTSGAQPNAVAPNADGIAMAKTAEAGWFARPKAGEAFYIFRLREADAPLVDYPHHGAGIIATSVDTTNYYDALTLEQIVARTGQEMTMDWRVNMYYVPSPKPEFAQHFTAHWKRTFQALEARYWRTAASGAVTIRELKAKGNEDAALNEFATAPHALSGSEKCGLHDFSKMALNLEAFAKEFDVPFTKELTDPKTKAKTRISGLTIATARVVFDYSVAIYCGYERAASLSTTYPVEAKGAKRNAVKLEFGKIPGTDYVYPKTCMNSHRYADALADQQQIKVGDAVRVVAVCDIWGNLMKMPEKISSSEKSKNPVAGPGEFTKNHGYLPGTDACQVVKAPEQEKKQDKANAQAGVVAPKPAGAALDVKTGEPGRAALAPTAAPAQAAGAAAAASKAPGPVKTGRFKQIHQRTRQQQLHPF